MQKAFIFGARGAHGDAARIPAEESYFMDFMKRESLSTPSFMLSSFVA